jgi:hypothetical protein
MTHKFECFEGIQHYAICEFNQCRKALEELHGAPIKVKKMYYRFGWKVEYVLESEATND